MSGKQAYYTIPELARTYKLSYKTIWNWVKSSKLKAIRVKGEIRVSYQSFKKLID